jgi:hypothetical protein
MPSAWPYYRRACSFGPASLPSASRPRALELLLTAVADVDVVDTPQTVISA